MNFNNFSNVDAIRLTSPNVVYKIELKNGESLICRINHDKINYEELSNTPKHELVNKTIIVEKVISMNDFKNSRFKEGYEDYEVLVTKIKAYAKHIDLLR